MICFICDKITNKLYFYDFCYKNKIIEFHGDFWHMNPIRYSANDVNKKTKIKAIDIWEHDKFKNNLCKENGYKLKNIWESDYKKNKEHIILECIKYLNNE